MTDVQLRSQVIGKLLDTAGDPACDDHFAIDKWEWPQGVALYSLYLASVMGGDSGYLDFIRAWFDRRLLEPQPVRNVNTCAPLLSLAFLAEHDNNPNYRAVCADWAEWIMREMPRTEEGGLQHVTSHLVNEGELWADTLFMTVLFLAKAGRLLGREEYVAEASCQFLLHIKYLTDRSTGLWFHGWTFKDRGHFGRIRWARGNAWFAAGALDFIRIAEPDAATRRVVEETLKSQLRALVALQDESGLWHTILDDSESYLETSASAAIAYGLLRTVGAGIADASMLAAARKAVAGVRSCIREDGTVTGVSHGTAVGLDRDHYLRIPLVSTAYGQGLTFLMLVEAGAAGMAMHG